MWTNGWILGVGALLFEGHDGGVAAVFLGRHSVGEGPHTASGPCLACSWKKAWRTWEVRKAVGSWEWEKDRCTQFSLWCKVKPAMQTPEVDQGQPLTGAAHPSPHPHHHQWQRDGMAEAKRMKFAFWPRWPPGVQLDFKCDYGPVDIFQFYFRKEVVKALQHNYSRHTTQPTRSRRGSRGSGCTRLLIRCSGCLV